ncbi:hypothetical protein NCAS_0H01220 [Naumovozyma castellii]|uniref:5'-deoxynucleotidase n=1 Tax=Naumovozyma castellii TaxID=27288 RepID=G0VIV5_NAUCA|nr:hypothetical protein NCAS_0H01220 [Naumovozyma castellii CBS 4309]CCC71432.1 hypothetical protein NCAS_0H01220 [Naumovozyma castellii CBS 4309]
MTHTTPPPTPDAKTYAMPTMEWRPEDNIPECVKSQLSNMGHSLLPHPLPFFHIIQELKIKKRTGWLDFQIWPCESIADHMYRMGVMTMLIRDPNVNKDKCTRIALVHDIAEALVGDITPCDPFVNKEEKHRRELATVEYLCEKFIKPYNEIAAEQLLNDWWDYEECRSMEARYVKDIDKYEVLLQCFEYERLYKGEKNLQEFFTAVELIKTDEVKSWINEVVCQRDHFFENVNQICI